MGEGEWGRGICSKRVGTKRWPKYHISRVFYSPGEGSWPTLQPHYQKHQALNIPHKTTNPLPPTEPFKTRYLNQLTQDSLGKWLANTNVLRYLPLGGVFFCGSVRLFYNISAFQEIVKLTWDHSYERCNGKGMERSVTHCMGYRVNWWREGHGRCNVRVFS